MPSETRTRRGGRGEATRTAIIEAAEILFADFGVEGVSLRQIGVASGSANTNVVSYHFGGKEALIAAVIRHRLPAIEEERTRMLDLCEGATDRPSLIDLLYIMFQPVIQQRNALGHRSYAAFLGGLFRSGATWHYYSFDQDYPTTRHILSLIRKHLALDKYQFKARMKICTNMIVSSLDLLARDMPLDSAEEHRQFLDVLSMADGALRAATDAPASFATWECALSEKA